MDRTSRAPRCYLWALVLRGLFSCNGVCKGDDMTAFYQMQPDCKSCADMLGQVPKSECEKCMSYYRRKVKVLKLGVGISKNEAIIELNNKQVVVPIDKLE